MSLTLACPAPSRIPIGAWRLRRATRLQHRISLNNKWNDAPLIVPWAALLLRGGWNLKQSLPAEVLGKRYPLAYSAFRWQASRRSMPSS